MTTRILVEVIGYGAGTQFMSDSGGTFLSDSGGTFEDSEGIARLSTEDFAGNRFWSGDILSIEPIALKLDKVYGGMVRLSGGGSMEIAMSAFSDPKFNLGDWFPGVSHHVQISVTDGLESSAILLLEGTLYRNKIDAPLSFGFGLYPEEYNVNALSSVTDYNGDTVVAPLAIGTVSYVVPVRLADAGGGNRRYSAGGLTGTKHTDWHVYDDGVDVCTNATAISANVFEYSVTPAGELTISGTGPCRAIGDVFDYFCGTSFLGISFSQLGGSGNIDRWQDSQKNVIDLLSDVAASVAAFCIIRGGTMYLDDMTNAPSADYVYDVETDTLEGTKLEKPAPISAITYEWDQRTAVEETIGKYVKTTPRKETARSNYPYGADESVDVFSLTQSTVYGRLVVLIQMFNLTRGFLSLPLTTARMQSGIQITLTDGRYSTKTITCDPMYVRDIVFDFMAKKVNLEGDVSLTASA